MKISQPMLAGKVEDIDKLKYPIYCTPKLDGIRCVIIEGRALTRKLKPVPNTYVRMELEAHFPSGLDGELMVVKERDERGNVLSWGTFNEAQSAVMAEKGEPDFVFLVFDFLKGSSDPNIGYVSRMEHLKDWFRGAELSKDKTVCQMAVSLLPTPILTKAALLEYETECLEQGYEGVMIRSANGPYKMGRSTAKEGYLLKLKRFADDEAEVIGFVERMHNENEQTRDERGYAKRSSHKAGKVPAGTLGALVVKMKDGREFQIGTGFDDAQRREIWYDQEKYLGRWATFKSQPFGEKDLPRFPIFLHFRDERDIGRAGRHTHKEAKGDM